MDLNVHNTPSHHPQDWSAPYLSYIFNWRCCIGQSSKSPLWMTRFPSGFSHVCMHVLSHSIVFDSATPWPVAWGLLCYMDCNRGLPCPWGFSRQEYWSGLPCPPPGDFPNPGIKPRSPTLQVDSLPSEPVGKTSPMYPWGICVNKLLFAFLLLIFHYRVLAKNTEVERKLFFLPYKAQLVG